MSLLLLAIAFVTTGLTLISTKLIVAMGLGGYAVAFVMTCTAAAAVTAAICYSATRSRVEKRDAQVGIVMGASGAVAMVLLVITLRYLPGVVVFPVRSSGCIALTAGASCMLFHERITARQWLGIACAVAAVYLLV